MQQAVLRRIVKGDRLIEMRISVRDFSAAAAKPLKRLNIDSANKSYEFRIRDTSVLNPKFARSPERRRGRQQILRISNPGH